MITVQNLVSNRFPTRSGKESVKEPEPRAEGHDPPPAIAEQVAGASAGTATAPIQVLGDSQLPVAAPDNETQLPCSPTSLLKTDAAQKTLSEVETKEAALGVAAEEEPGLKAFTFLCTASWLFSRHRTGETDR